MVQQNWRQRRQQGLRRYNGSGHDAESLASALGLKLSCLCHFQRSPSYDPSGHLKGSNLLPHEVETRFLISNVKHEQSIHDLSCLSIMSSHEDQLHVWPAGPMLEVGISLEADHDAIPAKTQGFSTLHSLQSLSRALKVHTKLRCPADNARSQTLQLCKPSELKKRNIRDRLAVASMDHQNEYGHHGFDVEPLKRPTLQSVLKSPSLNTLAVKACAG